ncbi:MAG: class I SAM-dependent methyltransferase [Xanthomonadales bacterium]|nr:class I SAM-dependent methyltransferase [Xanthomonadales bacterium]
MKVPDSGMPDEDYWNQLMDIPAIIDWLACDAQHDTVVEIGCGYGSFTLPLASRCQHLYAFDIEPAMVQRCQQALLNANIPCTLASQPTDFIKAVLSRKKCIVRQCNIVEYGTGLPKNSADLVLIFNLLHGPDNFSFLQEAQRVLKPQGRLAVIHWRRDIPTPRGPDVSVRPTATELHPSLQALGFELHQASTALGDFHWGAQWRLEPSLPLPKSTNKR